LPAEPDHSFGAVRDGVRRRIVLIALCAVVGAGLAFVHARRAPKQYSATAQLLFGSNSGVLGLLGIPVQNGAAGTGVVSSTNAVLVGLPVVADRTRAQLGSQLPPGGVSVSTSVTGTTNLVAVTATAPTPEGAALVANTYSLQFITYSQQQQQQQVTQAIAAIEREIDSLRAKGAASQAAGLETTLAQLQSIAAADPVDVSLVQRATPPSSPNSSRTVTKTVEGLLIGLIVGFLVAMFVEWADPRLRSVAQVSAGGFTIIARDKQASVGADPERAMALRVLRAALANSIAGESQVIAVTSSGSAADTALARQHGMSLGELGAESGSDVALIDLTHELEPPPPGSDMTEDEAGEDFGPDDETPVDAVHSGMHTPRAPSIGQVARHPVAEGLDLVALRGGDLVRDSGVSAILHDLQRDYQLIVVVLSDSDALSAAKPFLSGADAAVFVSRLGISRRRRVDRGLATLRAVGPERRFLVVLSGRGAKRSRSQSTQAVRPPAAA
jgi:capsular polysaccharide biosynthesis protein